ncbi:hypothetical protein [Absidia glauca]|uniref:Ndc10 domain-containing protein n=1 Tax=Absidia glauca TaxID=4829 RepID=A0A168QYA3_ABSGL|nr:hypothetical protein [Absidia glauca]
MHVCWYQTLATQYIVLPVKFENGLSNFRSNSQNFETRQKVNYWAGQPAFKFDKDMDVPRIYCMIPRNMHLDVEWVHERYNKL